jgi:hypothetical protein
MHQIKKTLERTAGAGNYEFVMHLGDPIQDDG